MMTTMTPPPQEKEVLVDEHGALVMYYPRFLSEQSAVTLLHELSREVSWNLETDDFGLQDRCVSFAPEYRPADDLMSSVGPSP